MSNLTCPDSNLSHDVVTDDWWLLEDDQRTNGLVIFIISMIYIFIGMPANVFIIVCVLRMKLYEQPAMIALMNLTLVDLLLCAIVLPFNIIPGIAGEFVLGNSDFVRCKVCQIGIFYITLSLASLFSVTMVSVDRFLFIKIPLLYDKFVTVRRMIIVVLITWFVCILISVLPILGFGRIYFSKYVATCTIDTSADRGYVLLLVGVSLIPLSILAVTNVWVVNIVRKQLRRIYQAYRTCSSDVQRQQLSYQINKRIKCRRNQKQLNLIRIFLAIFFVDIFTWIPILILLVLTATIRIDQVPIWYTSFSFLTLTSQAVLHPILEAFMVSEIKEVIVKLCKYKDIGHSQSNSDNQNEYWPEPDGKEPCNICHNLRVWFSAATLPPEQ